MSLVRPLLWLAFASALATQSDPRTEDWRWLDEHRAEAFEALMPLHPDTKTVVGFRSYRVLYQDVVEKYFRIDQPGVEAFSATVLVPGGRSLQDQLLEAHMDDTEADLPALLGRVRLKSLSLEDASCPAIREQLAALDTLRFSVPDRELLIIHPPIYSVAMDFFGGSLEAELHDDGHPLVVWALETHSALLRCVRSSEQ